MKAYYPQSKRLAAMALPLLTAVVLQVTPVRAQNPELQQRIAEIKQASAANKQALSHYTWQESQTTSIKGEVKKQQLFQVSVGPDGKQQKTEIGGSQAPPPPSGGRLKQHIVEKKKAEFKDYGSQIGDLAKQYTQPDPARLQQAFQQGNVSLQPGGEGEVTLVIKNYIKPNDSVTLVFNRQQKAIQSVKVATYLDDPQDAVTISAQFAKLPDGTNHVTSTQMNGVSKQLTVVTQNSNYQPA